MKNWVFIILVFFVTYSRGQTTVTSRLQSATIVGSYELYEEVFDLSQVFSNPYDPGEISVDAIISTPSGGVLRQPCFYKEDVSFSGSLGAMTTVNVSQGSGTWNLRFSPMEVGQHQITLEATDAVGTAVSSALPLDVVGSSEKGFVRIHPDNKQYNQFDNGDPYYPMGINLGWAQNGDLIHTYGDYIPQMSGGGANWFRYWMTDFARQSLMWSSEHWAGWYQGLGWYSQEAAGMLDSVVSLAEENDMYIQLVMNDHGQFSNGAEVSRWTQDGSYPGNPYSTAHGGMCATVLDFFTRTDAKEEQKKYYRYVIARWGYSQNIFAWEFFNEIQFTDVRDNPNEIDDWHDEMSTYVKSIDAHQHLTTTSWKEEHMALLEDNAGMDNVQYHIYNDPIVKPLLEVSEELNHDLNKQVFCGEYGLDVKNEGYTNHPDSEGDHVRKTNWASTMRQVPAFFWFWDKYINDQDLFHLYFPLRDYLSGEDLGAQSNLESIDPIVVTAPPGDLVGIDFQPEIGWSTDPPLASSFSIDDLGMLSPGEDSMQSYLFGTWAPERGAALEFDASWIEAGEFVISVSNVAVSGTKGCRILIDGLEVLNEAFNAPGDKTVAVPIGAHTVRIENLGQDWVKISNLNFKGITLETSLDVYGLQSDEVAYGYVIDKRYGQWSTLTDIVSGASIEIEGMKSGDYDVTYYDPVDGGVLLEETIGATGGDLLVGFPSFTKEVAYKVKWQDITSLNSLSESNQDDFYPNPVVDRVNFHEEVNYSIMDNQGRVLSRGIGSETNVSSLKPGIFFIKINGVMHKVLKTEG